MKNATLSIISAAILISGFLIVGCSDGTDQPSNQTETDEMEVSGLPELMVQTSDSLLFTRANVSDDIFTLKDTHNTAPFIAFTYIEPSPPINSIRSYEPGTEVHISLDENLIVTARINRNQAVGESIRTLTGPLINFHIGHLTLGVDENSITGTIDLLSEDRLFYIRYDRTGGHHYLAEVDRSKLDIQEGSQPLKMN
ncbi:hypothetical protein [Rhodohalobacter sp.]|uniref:hypothetical protein n=1 Tax=Rhodohalobacter sp. TaxID=1974210 RepID=UPI002ACD5339|nr:hypothetical protein [Rhodohalobacter sp.]MDZ7757211.1 hypothetical protein [Rhodohalobacter sp.]